MVSRGRREAVGKPSRDRQLPETLGVAFIRTKSPGYAVLQICDFFLAAAGGMGGGGGGSFALFAKQMMAK